MKAGSDVVIVSSGAIAAGIEPLGLTRRPTDLATKQAAASVGQVALVNAWSAAFGRYDRTVGQVLLTAHDISMRVQHTNAQRTLDRLRALHAVAIVNENDTVATNEIRFGDNDRLSALVAHLVGADALILLTDIDGLYDGDPRKVRDAARSSPRWPDPTTSTAWWPAAVAASAPAAWRPSCRRRCWPPTPACRCCWPRPPMPAAALADASVGTVFAPRPERMSARRFWVRYAAESSGALTLDDGAVRAVRQAAPVAAARRDHRRCPAGSTAATWSSCAARRGDGGRRGVVAYDAAELADDDRPLDLGPARRDAPARGARRRPGRRLERLEIQCGPDDLGQRAGQLGVV